MVFFIKIVIIKNEFLKNIDKLNCFNLLFAFIFFFNNKEADAHEDLKNPVLSSKAMGGILSSETFCCRGKTINLFYLKMLDLLNEIEAFLKNIMVSISPVK